MTENSRVHKYQTTTYYLNAGLLYEKTNDLSFIKLSTKSVDKLPENTSEEEKWLRSNKLAAQTKKD